MFLHHAGQHGRRPAPAPAAAAVSAIAAADRVALVRHGRRAAASRRRRLGRFGDIGLHQQREIARHLAQRAGRAGPARSPLRRPGRAGYATAGQAAPAKFLRPARGHGQSPGRQEWPGCPLRRRTAAPALACAPRRRRCRWRSTASRQPAAFRPKRGRQRMLHPGAADHGRVAMRAREAGERVGQRRQVARRAGPAHRAVAARGRCRSRPGWLRPSARTCRLRRRRAAPGRSAA